MKYRRRIINSFGDLRYSELESFGKGYHSKLQCLVWDSNMAAGNQWKHLEFTLALFVNLENIRIGTSLNILVTQNSKTQNESTFSCN